jgi:hypothetical protein
MGAAAYSVSLVGLNDALTLILQVIVGVLVYVAISVIFKIESFDYIFSMIRKVAKKKPQV